MSDSEIGVHVPSIVTDGKGIHRLELLGMNEPLNNATDRRRFFGEIQPALLERFLVGVNTATRKESASKEYADGHIPSNETPPLQDKTKLVVETIEAVQTILKDTNLTDQDALRRGGITLAAGINLIHPFSDGNGRTG